MAERQHQKTLQELYEEAYGKKKNKKSREEYDETYRGDEFEDDDADCFCC